MAYATLAQIQTAAGGADRYVQLFDWDADGAVDTAVLTELQAEVDSWIDSFAGARFATPMTSPSTSTSLCAAEEVVYRARARRGTVRDEERIRHEERLAWLRDIASGRAVPCDPQPAKASSVRSAWVSRDDDDVSRNGMGGAW